MTDQTAQRPDTYTGQRVLIIASGHDLDSRKGFDVSKYDIVCKVNKDYGNITQRADIIITRWAKWLDIFFSQNQLKNAQKVIIINQNLGISHTEVEIAKQIAGLAHVSAGFLAVLYFFNRGAKCVDLIGFGQLCGQSLGAKRYCKRAHNYKDGMRDNNANYNFEREHAILATLPTVNFL